MHSRYSGQGTLRLIGTTCMLGLLAAVWTPVEASSLSSDTAYLQFPTRLLEGIRDRHLEYTRAAVRGPRGGAVARGPRGAVARGPHGGVAARGPYGGAAARGPAGNVAVRPGYRPPVPAGGWYRPPSYWWRPGAAVAAGAALGFVTAAAATTYAASPSPGTGYCWYYTNSQRTQGFWDVCPK
ncbi:hypothetical protein [Microvirga lotononidis]|uniref:Uncharacterized protein n=1 Tax=Microvirga lotononidis TaxID=864069 RepID=I4YXS2_9HYPH|nr:hypothetical protein [Microvirga lotononidis]EIM28764.1 hypothetical protein MicloDRAFT_00024080 [Microvirga lotononidis]WQO25502.1 hypothetical protein U0023_12285 [Microvirga lotononidis]